MTGETVLRPSRRRHVIILVLFLMLAASLFGAASFADSRFVIKPLPIWVFKDGEKLDLSTEPFVVGGELWLPLCQICEALGASTHWSDLDGSVTVIAGERHAVFDSAGRLREAGSLPEGGLPGSKGMGATRCAASIDGSSPDLSIYPYLVLSESPLKIESAGSKYALMVPVRALQMALDIWPYWDDYTRTVIIGPDELGYAEMLASKVVVTNCTGNNYLRAQIGGGEKAEHVYVSGTFEFDNFDELWAELNYGESPYDMPLYISEIAPFEPTSEGRKGKFILDDACHFDAEIDLTAPGDWEYYILDMKAIDWGEGGRPVGVVPMGAESDYLMSFCIRRSGDGYVFETPRAKYNNMRALRTLRSPESYLDMDYLSVKDGKYIRKKSDDICMGAKSDYEKLLKIHDYLTEHMYYNSDYYQVYDDYTMSWEGVGENYDTTIEILEHELSQCYGFSIAFTDLARAQGIPCTKVIGPISYEAFDLEFDLDYNHAWNIAYADGRWIIIDVTWDNNNSYSTGSKWRGLPVHVNFDVNIDFHSQDHRIDYFREEHIWD